MFVDTALITVRSGKGGDGCTHLLRIKGNAKGGPDGGDGGRGGSVFLIGDPHVDTLVQLGYRPHWFAQDGESGSKKCKSGKAGNDLLLPVPLGTQVFDANTDELLADVTQPNTPIELARGGEGGLGNDRFKSAVHQTPLESTPGGPSVELQLRVELRLIADVGLVGLPNAGKSTWLKAATRAQPKIADYPFTTLAPQLGIAQLSDDRRLVLADLPGLIEGAAQGTGLGHDFLRHIERTRVIVHVISVVPDDEGDPLESHRIIRRELAEFSEKLARTAEIVVLNKVDLLPHEQRRELLDELLHRFKKERGITPFVTSGATKEGVTEVLEAAWMLNHPAQTSVPFSPRQTS